MKVFALIVIMTACSGSSSSPGDDGGDDGGDDAPNGDAGGDAGDGGCGVAPDVVGAMQDMDLSVAGRVFEMDLGALEYGRYVTPGNGCEVTSEAAIGFGGARGVRTLPPTVNLGGDAQYCGFASGAPVSRNGASGQMLGVDVGSLNLRYALYIGRGFTTATATGNGPKAVIPFVVDDEGNEGFSSRPMVFWGQHIEHGGKNYGAIGVTEGTVQSYQEPENDFFPAGPGQDAIYFGPGADHSGSETNGTPVIGDEWVIIEHEWDLRRDRGNSNGLNRLYVWTRDGVIDGSVLDIPLTWDAGHEFAGDRFSMLDGLGYYWNLPGVRTADDHMIYSHVAFSANRPAGQPIGPPPGFLTSCP